MAASSNSTEEKISAYRPFCKAQFASRHSVALIAKFGNAAFTNLAINATEWRDANWALQKGLYADIFSSVELLDAAIKSLSEKLSKRNPEAMADLKKIAWEGTSHWDKLLFERAAISGKLVLSEFTVNAINSFKKK